MFRHGAIVLTAISAVFAIPAPDHIEERALACNGTFKKISAADWVKAANPGWNLGNTLDGIPTEGSWGPAAKPADFDTVKASGFKAVRIPVTWTDHFLADGTTVDPVWLQRVSDVVDYALTRSLYAIVNVHHDSWNEFDLTKGNFPALETQFYNLWLQIGTKLGCKASLLAFEPLNEPTGSTPDQFAELNKLNTIFLQALKDSGGFNAQRVVTLVGPGEDSIKTAATFTRPSANFTNPWAIQFHYYSPYDFIFSAWGKTIWGSDADIAAVDTDFANIRNNFTDVPIIIGEWESNQVDETTARWKYFNQLQVLAKKYGFGTFLWDNTASQLDRSIEKWRDQTAINILMAAVAGKPNALPDSTEDSSLSQFSNAYIYHKVGTPVTDQSLSYNFNTNTLSSLNGPTGSALKKNTDYTVSGSNVTYKASLLSKYITTTTAPGSVTNFTLKFSKGAALTANLLQWDVSTIASNGSSAAAANAAGTDLAIPITWKGINKPAAVQAVLPDGTCLVDTWTVYLPPLQQCRTTYSSQWDFDNSHIILKAATVQAAVAAAQPVTFTFEFYPRQPGNNATYTLTL